MGWEMSVVLRKSGGAKMGLIFRGRGTVRHGRLQPSALMGTLSRMTSNWSAGYLRSVIFSSCFLGRMYISSYRSLYRLDVE
jgi:hypothetical protein